jgi:TPR repeat protein
MRSPLCLVLLALWVGAARAATPQVDALWAKGDFRRAFAQTIEPAIRGDAHAQFLIGEAYRLGRSVDPNMPLAQDWYQRAARQGDVGAATELGLLLIGQHLDAAALPWLTMAAQHGEPRALCSLAALYYNGDGVVRDEARAFALMSRAAAAGLPEARARLATLRTLVSPAVQAQSATLGPVAPSVTSPAPVLAMPRAASVKEVRPVRVQVGAFRSAAAAEQAWSLLTARIAGSGTLDHAVVRADGWFRLQAQLGDNEAARDFRRKLLAAGWQNFTRQRDTGQPASPIARNRSAERLRPDKILERRVADHERLAKAGVGISLAHVETLRAYIDRIDAQQQAPRATRARFRLDRFQQAPAPAARLPWTQKIDPLQFKVAFGGRAIERGRCQQRIADGRAQFGFQYPCRFVRVAKQLPIPVHAVAGIDVRHDRVAGMIVRKAVQERRATQQSQLGGVGRHRPPQDRIAHA